MIPREKIFPAMLIALSIGAAFFYFLKNWRMGVYYVAAAVLNYVVNF